jgi:hypothetical protein
MSGYCEALAEEEARYLEGNAMPARPDICEICSKPARDTRTLFSWRSPKPTLAALCPECIKVADGGSADARADLWQSIQIRRDQEARERAE